jgi:hypothetical protein
MDERDITVKLKMTDNRIFEIKINLAMLVADVKALIESVRMCHQLDHARSPGETEAHLQG